ncbi:MAG TPA: malto-oligosyltrehalose synthase [Pseudosphingobacterium sp.]|nr:malto-oligosyltrehalose synthase [Pseudosphingobacterium sp.]
MTKVFNPISTYRLQFHKKFTFKDAKRLVPYLAQLGIGSVYASPIFKAVKGSMHGYDVVDPLTINPEIGSLQDLRELTSLLQKHQIAWIQDIVPNHMAFHSENNWLMELLENGPYAKNANVFDTSFASHFFEGPLMVPFLGRPLSEVISHGELTLVLQDNKLKLAYFDQVYPINALGYSYLLQTSASGKKPVVIKKVEQRLAQLLLIQDAEQFQIAWQSVCEIWEGALLQLNILHYIQDLVSQMNGNKEELLRLCDKQHYKLCHWMDSDAYINYRRFFTVNSLICVQVQEDEVFNRTHSFIRQLVQEGLFQGLRIDHIDGLFDPVKYLHDLRTLVGKKVYIIAEKILEDNEQLPTDWTIQGTSGYDYLATSNRLFTMQENKKAFDSFYQKLVPQKLSVQRQIASKKALILQQHMRGEQHNLLQLFKRLKLVSKEAWKELSEERVGNVIASILIYFPTYRFYGNKLPLSFPEQQGLRHIFDAIRKRSPQDVFVVNLLEGFLLDKSVVTANSSSQAQLLYFYQRLMQFSGPLMAKGVEDTLMYTYNRFIVNNEVGDAPGAFGMNVKQFHEAMEQRQCLWPYTMNSTATHDTKRGEDIRARLHALSCLPNWWKEVLTKLETTIGDKLDEVYLPDMNDRYFIYQTVIASYPIEKEERHSYEERLTCYLQKALREAKEHSNWTVPNEEYEQRCVGFARLVIDPKEVLLPIWYSLWAYINDQGMLSSLAQAVLKLTVPGLPDVYQGTESWDLSLVDPDNRRPVNYVVKKNALKTINSEYSNFLSLWQSRQNGTVKLFVIKQLLHYRRRCSELFAKGLYMPLRVRGRYRKHVLAFARRYQNNWSISVIPLHLAALCHEQHCAPEDVNWKNTRLDWPIDWPTNFKEVFSAEERVIKEELLLSDLFKNKVPLAVLHASEQEKKRKAGILMPISSLPSPFGIGDLGPQAYIFADQLARAGQSYWQMLPMNPAGSKEYYSPYSAFSAFAGNPLLISLEKLAQEGLLTKRDLRDAVMANDGKVNYAKVEKMKCELLQKAFGYFSKNKFSPEYEQFLSFLEKEAGWLDDFATYLAVKKDQRGKPWYEWPHDLRSRQKRSMDKVINKYTTYILFIKWQQYVFFKQWAALQEYCRALSIRLFGDLPIYVNHDAVDVWAHQQLFKLDESGQMLGVAGVPPDYFNADGQLWGMPVFNWNIHKEQQYAWWIARINKNLELYDLLRLDHFRAFYDYWEAPANAKTAIKGEWKNGPGEHFFQALSDVLGKLPFVAEDLGDIHEGVYTLRDQFKLPGMRVLQFAFGEDLPSSIHVPHQYSCDSVAYTGTHDNNTTKGWYKTELDKAGRKRLQQYVGHEITSNTVCKELIRMAYMSVSELVVIPLQDVLALSEKARMNMPATVEDNWTWRLKEDQLSSQHLRWLQTMVRYYGR